MQQARMIRVLDVLDIELPVVVQDLRGRAEDFRLAAHDPADPRPDQIADIIGQWRGIRGQRAENEPGKLVGAQFFQPVIFEMETLGHAALAADAATERDARQIAGEVVAPGVIDAGQPVFRVAALFQADEIAAMGAAVDHRMDVAVLPARDDDRGLAEKTGLVVARFGQLVGEAEILPARAEKDPVAFGAVDFGVCEDLVRDARVPLFRPFERVLIHRLTSGLNLSPSRGNNIGYAQLRECARTWAWS